MTKKKAIENGVIKWRYASKTGCDKNSLFKWVEEKWPKSKETGYYCSLCEKYKDDCRICPLEKKYPTDCNKWYHKWYSEKDTLLRKKYANEMYKRIKSLK